MLDLVLFWTPLELILSRYKSYELLKLKKHAILKVLILELLNKTF